MRGWHYIAVGALFPFAVQAQQVDTSYNNGHYRQRLAYFRQMPDQQKEIVFLGNSITEAGEWQELVPNKHVINRGISGDVTFGIKARLDEVLSSKPAKIFLLIGVNDMKRGHSPAVIAATYEAIVKQIVAASPKTKLYLQSILPVNESLLQAIYKEVNNGKIAELNGLVKALAAKYSARYVNLHEVFAGLDGQLTKDMTTDGLHLQPAAYIKWTDYLKQKKYL
jgi:lysophospholipase L1-like esterase